MKKLLVAVGLAAALVAAPPADARTLTTAKAKKFLKGTADELAASIVEELQSDPNAPPISLVNSQVNDCKKRNKNRVDCDIAFTFRPADGSGDFNCELRVKVKYRNKHSKKLVADLASEKVKCRDV
jgi:hypothetical protein